MTRVLEAPAAPASGAPTSPAALVADHCFVAYPLRPGECARRTNPDTGKIAIQPPAFRRTITLGVHESSDYCRNFNRLWCDAHNHPRTFTHFAMSHDDVRAEAGWLDQLIDEMDRVGADLLSVVIPIKDPRGVTSTAVRDPMTGRIRRLTMTEVFRLPETFSIEDVTAAGIQLGRDDTLLVNTGLWVVRWDKPKLARFRGFNTTHQVSVGSDGRMTRGELTEDWDWSEWARRAGLKVFATRKILAIHLGADGAEYANDLAWGTHETDPGD